MKGLGNSRAPVLCDRQKPQHLLAASWWHWLSDCSSGRNPRFSPSLEKTSFYSYLQNGSGPKQTSLLHLSSVSKLSSAAAVIKTSLFVTKHLNYAIYSKSETQIRNSSSFILAGMFYCMQWQVFSIECFPINLKNK